MHLGLWCRITELLAWSVRQGRSRGSGSFRETRKCFGTGLALPLSFYLYARIGVFMTIDAIDGNSSGRPRLDTGLSGSRESAAVRGGSTNQRAQAGQGTGSAHHPRGDSVHVSQEAGHTESEHHEAAASTASLVNSLGAMREQSTQPVRPPLGHDAASPSAVSQNGTSSGAPPQASAARGASPQRNASPSAAPPRGSSTPGAHGATNQVPRDHQRGAQMGQKAVELAHSFKDRATHTLVGALPNFTAAGGHSNNCADFVTSILKNVGQLNSHHTSVPDLKHMLNHNPDFQRVPRDQAQPGDVWISHDHGHTELVADEGAQHLIGSNNGGRSTQHVSFDSWSPNQGGTYYHFLGPKVE